MPDSHEPLVLQEDFKGPITPEHIAAFKGEFKEILITSPRWGEICLVAEHTDQHATRFEFTPEEFKIINDAVKIFDGEITQIKHKSDLVRKPVQVVPRPDTPAAPAPEPPKDIAAIQQKLLALKDRLGGNQ